MSSLIIVKLDDRTFELEVAEDVENFSTLQASLHEVAVTAEGAIAVQDTPFLETSQTKVKSKKKGGLSHG